VVYLDFQWGFDKVPHNRLLSKLKSYGLTGMVLNLINDFLSNRRQKVAVLGPTLFIIYYVNDPPDIIQSYVGIFADDTKI